jgi:hypothetical protein
MNRIVFPAHPAGAGIFTGRTTQVPGKDEISVQSVTPAAATPVPASVRRKFRRDIMAMAVAAE